MWSTPIDLYCERLDASFWAEPLNAVSNIAFVVAAAAAYADYRRAAARDGAVLALIVIGGIVGLGSFAFHTLATRGAMLLDVVPIGVFIYGYLLLALRRFLRLSFLATAAVWVAFVALSIGLATWVPRAVLNGSSGYFPALAALIVIGWMRRADRVGRTMLAAAALFVPSLILRIVDLELCPAFPIGTHFFWHLLNAGVIYAVLHGAIADRTRTEGRA